MEPINYARRYHRGYFRGKKITIMGLGLLGRGVGDAIFFANERAELIVTDLKSKEQLAQSVEALRGFDNITFVLGEHRLEDFRGRDFILKAAGVPFDSIYIEEARKHKVPVEMSTSLFAALTPAQIVGVTGTRGKSTVTHLLYEILNEAFGDKKKVFLGGNVKGVSTLPFLYDTKPGDVAVLELDSWQLQGFGERKLSPHVAIFTTFLPDHLNYYHGRMDAYLEDKSNIFKFQSEDDFLVLGRQAATLVKERYTAQIKSSVIEVEIDYLPADWQVQMPGLHNRYNAALAMRAAEVFNISKSTIKPAVENFPGVPGRLEQIGESKGVKIYNDTTSTTPDATLAALRAFGPGRINVLIMGGTDKNLDMGHLFLDLPNYAKAVVLLSGTGSTRIEPDLMKVEDTHVEKAATLEKAVAQALKLCQKGDNLLFSPGFSSFDMFLNEFDRGDQFNKIISELK